MEHLAAFACTVCGLHGLKSGKTHHIAAACTFADCIPFCQQCLVHLLSLYVLGSSSCYRSIAVDLVHSAGPGKRAAKANTSIKRGMLAVHCVPLHDVCLKVQAPPHVAFPWRPDDMCLEVMLGALLQTHLVVLSHCCLIDWVANIPSQGCIVVCVVLLLVRGM